ncbi:MAG TPA: DUF5995 family protein [Thermoleophilaceae bacterium]|nr:DUF5995 family protein [Thermoleophilaceae bacterium]
MGFRGLTALAIAAVAATPACAGVAGASDHPANVQWETLLPAMPSSTRVQPHAVPFCRTATVACVDTEIRRLRAAQTRFRCDHRAVFATTYLELTRELRRTLRRDPRFFRWPRYLYLEDALFADVYFNSLRADRLGKPVPPAWRIAFETAKSGQVNAAQDMLLGINAHVQNDMPFVLAALGLRSTKGDSRKPDHDKVNLILDAAYEPVVRAISRRFDPFVDTTNASWNPLDDVGGLEMVKGWREQVWRNAERLLSARDAAERRQVASQIQQGAAAWARMIAAPQTPNYRAQRDAYCAKHVR